MSFGGDALEEGVVDEDEDTECICGCMLFTGDLTKQSECDGEFGDDFLKNLFNDKINSQLTQLNLSFLANGIYIISITQKNLSYSKKLIIQ